MSTNNKEKPPFKTRLKEFAKRFVAAVEALFFPKGITCNMCGRELADDTRYGLCSDCVASIPFTSEHICLSCGVEISDEADYCDRCQSLETAYKLNRSPMVYDGGARRLIYKLKFGNKRYLAECVGAMMADEFLNRGMSAEIAVFVPMTAKEERKRGFNQSELLATDVAGRLKLPLLPALVKTKETPQQKKLSREERTKNLEGAYSCAFSQVKGRSILLIDDVFTTGATANECAKTLIKAGAREVSVLTAAITKLRVPFEAGEAPDGKKSKAK